MHVTLISQCKLRALARTRLVLDAYAFRRGDSTWMTPITQEGLETVRSQLRATATRQTAVACYVNDGTLGMRLAWVVGSKSGFDATGVVPVGSRYKPSSAAAEARSHPDPSPGLRMAAMLARLSGYMHDLGKFGHMFQHKLSANGPLADAIRHEWLSLHLLTAGAAAGGAGLHGAGAGARADARADTRADAHLAIESLGAKLGTHWNAGWALARPAAGPAGGTGGLARIDSLYGRGSVMQDGLSDAWSTLLYLVFTHHRLPTDQGSEHFGRRAPPSNMLSDDTYIRHQDLEQAAERIRPAGLLSPATILKASQLAPRVAKLAATVDDDPVLWRAVATLARMGLILADHSVSGMDMSRDKMHGPQLGRATGIAFANTVRREDGSRVLNQELNWHLQQVGDGAGAFVDRISSFQGPGLSDEVLAALREPCAGRFAWQSDAADQMRAAQAQERLPTLVFNVAGTGCGKTRMNVVAVASLNEQPGSDDLAPPVRFATALNLRTLTLQTRDAYASQLGMGLDDLACVIGSEIVKRLHESSAGAHEPGKPARPGPNVDDESWGVDEDGNPEEDAYDAIGDSDLAPPWLEHFLAQKPKMRPVVMAPVLVCTVDHLANAGDPTHQGNYALTNLRLRSSDLVLDEIDSYDPPAMVAVMRVITMAAFWGRNVVASSATLSAPVARSIWLAYDLGARMRAKLQGQPTAARFRAAMIDDRCPARLGVAEGVDEFDTWFRSSLGDMLKAYGFQQLRIAELARVELEPGAGSDDIVATLDALHATIARTCSTMHLRHRWSIEVDGHPHQISLGLVRIANIRRAVQAARHLNQALPGARVACYHSQLPRIARFLLERSLDGMLNRKDGSPGPQSCPEVIEAVRRSRREGRSETPLIVVATPVEEIGRDHDFDWAVLEPSSVQSLVQAAGRVNRHRLVAMGAPNVAILQFNFKHLERGDGKPCFARPGLEQEQFPYPTHDLTELLDWDELARCGQIDARTRFFTDKHVFAQLDNDATTSALRSLSRRFLESASALWMGSETYDMARLRDRTPKDTYTQDESGRHYREFKDSARGPKARVWVASKVDSEPALPNGWLAWDHDVAWAVAQDVGLSAFQAFAVEVPGTPDGKPVSLVHSGSLGYFKPASQ